MGVVLVVSRRTAVASDLNSRCPRDISPENMGRSSALPACPDRHRGPLPGLHPWPPQTVAGPVPSTITTVLPALEAQLP